MADMQKIEQEEHPDAQAIRRQVEYYFSDENLPTDMHMLQCTMGKKNEFVSINRIAGFKRMRVFRPKSIISEALKKSAFLEVSADGKQVRRRVPLAGKTLLDDGDSDSGDITFDPRTNNRVLRPIQALPQVRKEYPPGLTKNMMKPTGFEKSHTEGPITPKEAQEDLTMYDPATPFIERIEFAIQRFKQKRRMHQIYAQVFTKWMRFGGIESSPNVMFGGLSKQELAQMDAVEITRAKATHNIPWDRNDEKLWVVDFVSVTKGFFSSFYPAKFEGKESAIKTACQVLRSFFNYLLAHQVCPEYKNDIKFSRQLCDQAEAELVQIIRAGQALPGAYNVAASTLFGGHHTDLYAADKEWYNREDDEWNANASQIGMKKQEATVVWKAGVIACGSDDQLSMLEQYSDSKGTKSFERCSLDTYGLEVVDIQAPTEDAKAVYNELNNRHKDKIAMEPLGKLVCKSWDIPDFLEWDLPGDKYPNGRPHKQPEGEYEFWVEKNVLDLCFKGMKMRAKVMKLDDDLSVLDTVMETYCSFYTWLPNELWHDHKPKEIRLLNRGLDEPDIKAQLAHDEEEEDELAPMPTRLDRVLDDMVSDLDDDFEL